MADPDSASAVSADGHSPSLLSFRITCTLLQDVDEDEGGGDHGQADQVSDVGLGHCWHLLCADVVCQAWLLLTGR